MYIIIVDWPQLDLRCLLRHSLDRILMDRTASGPCRRTNPSVWINNHYIILLLRSHKPHRNTSKTRSLSCRTNLLFKSEIYVLFLSYLNISFYFRDRYVYDYSFLFCSSYHLYISLVGGSISSLLVVSILDSIYRLSYFWFDPSKLL